MPNATTAPISASMIVRDEARRLSDCIEWLSRVAGEICVLDTGSADETVSLAESLGCKVRHFDWNDDFSAARNAALAMCRLPWILSIDADEVIADADRAPLLQLTAERSDRAYRFVTRNYTNEDSVSGFQPSLPNDPFSRGYAGWYPSAKVRLFPNRPEIAFEGAIHELPNASLERLGIEIGWTDIPIHHYPLWNADPARQEAKRAQYIALVKKKLADRPRSAKAHGELGDLYIDSGAIPEAVAAYKQAVALDPASGECLKNLGAALFLLGQVPSAEKALRLSVTLDPALEEGWRNLGVVLLQQQKFPEARTALTSAVALSDRHPDNLRYLAIAQSRCGDPEGAKASLRTLLARFPHHEEASAFLSSLTAGEHEGRQSK